MLFSDRNVACTLCSSISGCPSLNTASYFEQNFLGFLCLSGSCFSVTSASGHAEYKGNDSIEMLTPYIFIYRYISHYQTASS